MSDEFQFDHCVIVDGRAYGDAKFYGEWLLAAANAQSLWEQALEDQEFAEQVERLFAVCLHDFGISANWLLMKLHEDITRFVFPVDGDEESEAFVMMAGMGFFARRDHFYEMTLPSSLTVEKVRAAALELAKTEDREHFLHVEHLVTTMPYGEAMALHNRLRAGERIGPKHGNTLIGTLRKTYGPDFANGCTDDDKLSEVLMKLDERSLNLLGRAYERGDLEQICRRPFLTVVPPDERPER
jgi:hypothetical protein